jgi:hypothetical protein
MYRVWLGSINAAGPVLLVKLARKHCVWYTRTTGTNSHLASCIYVRCYGFSCAFDCTLFLQHLRSLKFHLKPCVYRQRLPWGALAYLLTVYPPFFDRKVQLRYTYITLGLSGPLLASSEVLPRLYPVELGDFPIDPTPRVCVEVSTRAFQRDMRG